MGDPSMRGPASGRVPYVVEPRKPLAKPNNPEENGAEVKPGHGAPGWLEALGLPSELLDEVKRRLPVVKPPEKKKERAFADLRDRLNKEKQYLERLASHAEKKRQEAEEGHAEVCPLNNMRLILWSWKWNRLGSKPCFPHRCLRRRMSRQLLTPQQSDAESAGNEEGAISDFDLAFGDDRGFHQEAESGASSTKNGSLLLLRTHVTLKVW